MTLGDALSKISYHLRGLDDDAPTFGGDEATYWLSLLNSKKNELFADVRQNWSEGFEVRSLGTVTASAAPVYNLPADFITPVGDADDDLLGSEVYVITTDGKRVNIGLIAVQERKSTQRNAYIAGANPQKLYITTEITADESIIGGTLYISGQFLPVDLTTENQVIICPDPEWLCIATAADIAFSDIIYEDRAEGLNAKANNLYNLMVQKNRRGTHGRSRKTPTVVRRIRSAR